VLADKRRFAFSMRFALYLFAHSPPTI
jgi:hypothetical protein